MRVANAGRLSVVLCALGLVVAAGFAGAGAAASASAAGSASAESVVGDAPSDPMRVQADNDTSNASRSVLVPSAAVTVGETTVGVEAVMFTVRQGTGSLFVKRLAAESSGGDASVTNLRMAVGERLLQRLGRDAPGLDGAEYAVSLGRVAAGGLDYRPGTAVARGTIGGAPAAPGGTADPADRSPRGSSFTVTNLSAPANATLGESYTVSARITNPGPENGTEIVRYAFGDVVLGRQIVELAPNASTNVSFDVSPTPLPDSAGTYTHSVRAFDDNATASVRLVEPNGSVANGSAANATRPPAGA